MTLAHPSVTCEAADLEGARRDLLLHTAGPPYIIVARDRNATPGGRTTGAIACETLDEAVDLARRLSQRGGDVYVVRNPVVDGRLYHRHHVPGCRHSGCRCPRVPVPPGNVANPPSLLDIAAISRMPIDIDPKGAEHESARAHARSLIDSLRSHVEIEYTLDSGRGLQGCVHIQPAAERADVVRWTEARALAKRIERWLAAHADGSLVTIDSVSNPNRFSRLAGFVNTKTGRVARMIQEGGGVAGQ